MVVVPEPLVFLFEAIDILGGVIVRRCEILQQAAGFIAHVLFNQVQQAIQIKDRFTLA